jgi:hypothetical protein
MDPEVTIELEADDSLVSFIADAMNAAVSGSAVMTGDTLVIMDGNLFESTLDTLSDGKVQ